MTKFRFETSIGTLTIRFGKEGIRSLSLPDRVETAAYENDKPDFLEGWDNAVSAVNKLIDYFNGAAVDFSSIKLDLGEYSDFFRTVSEEVGSIPYGTVSTYGRVAENIGKNGAARAVGRVMAGNPIPIIIPCHRVVAADGTLTGYSAAGGLEMKKYLLRLEKSEYFLKSI